ncbi:MAG: phosphocholine cytidylyltransferase family protein [Dehalococcoidia bacterium]
MKVIILAAGLGTRLRPLTTNIPKCLFKLSKDQTIIGRMVNIIKKISDSPVYVVTGFMHEKIEGQLAGVEFVHNPFYRVTNSIVSLWFAREHLDDDVIIINSDIVIQAPIFEEVLKIEHPAAVLIDSSKARTADYKVATYNDRVIMMSKELTANSGEYVGITKLSRAAAGSLKQKIEEMVKNDQIDEWYENALVNMILDDDFDLNYVDVSHLQWVEIDTVDDLLMARKICDMERSGNDV